MKEIEEESSMKDLDNYLNMLYEETSNENNKEGIKNQIIGTQQILNLCRNVLNLEKLIQNNAVMGALTRILQEQFKKSIDISFNILR